MNPKFFYLPIEKQNKIISAGYKVFSLNSYKKAPMLAIAEEAGISKSLLFHYFENKKSFYFFLCSNALDFIHKEKGNKVVGNDFFDVLKQTILFRIKMIKQYPFLFQFLMQAFYENTELLKDDFHSLLHETQTKQDILSSLDSSHLKHPEDLETLYDICFLLSEGYMYRHEKKFCYELDMIEKDSAQIFETLKRNFYKEER